MGLFKSTTKVFIIKMNITYLYIIEYKIVYKNVSLSISITWWIDSCL